MLLTSPLLARARLPHGFTTRHFPGIAPWRAGGSPFGPEALACLAEHGLGDGVPAHTRQVHGVEVAHARAGGDQGQADVLVTDRPELPLAVFTADCLAIVAYDPVKRRLALAHSGWRGTAEGAARVVVQTLREAGGSPGTFVCAIGPSIGPCCYEVDGPVIERLEGGFPDRWRSWVTPAGPGKWMLDLWRANEDQLVAAGVDPGRIDNLRLCTSCREDLFYSYRRQRGLGRLAAIAAVPARPGSAC